MFVVCVSLLEIEYLRSVSVQTFLPTARLWYICHHTYHVPESNLYFTVSTQLNLWSETRTDKKKSFKWKSSISYIFLKVLPHLSINYSINPSPTDNHSANMHLHKLLNDVQIFGLQEHVHSMRIYREFITTGLNSRFYKFKNICAVTQCEDHQAWQPHFWSLQLLTSSLFQSRVIC